MNKHAAARLFECLASPVRLDVYRLLVRAGSVGMVAGEIGAKLGVAPSNLSFHLRAMTQAGLLDVEQEGRFQRYRADLALMTGLVAYLTSECCSGHPELCAPLPAMAARSDASRPASRRKGRR